MHGPTQGGQGQGRRWDLAGVAALSLFVSAVTTRGGTFFLHLDAPNQDFAALSWARGCWEYSTEKMLGVFLLMPLYKIFGPSALWETALLILLTAVSVALIYELARLVSGSRATGLLAALLALALPAFQYFTRIHMGYVIPCLLFAWLAAWHKRWVLAGLCFGLTLIAHFGFAVIVAVQVPIVAYLMWRDIGWRGWKTWLAAAAAGIAPVLVVEALFYAYMGIPFLWSRGTLQIGVNWSGASGGFAIHPQAWLWAPTTAAGANGWLFAGLLGLGLFCPLVVRRNRTALAFSLAYLGATLAFGILALNYAYGEYISRPLAPLYPFWALGAGVVAGWLLHRLPGMARRAGLGVALAGLMMGIVNTGVFIRDFTNTPYPTVDEWIERAGEAHRPVRFNNAWVGYFYAQQYGVEMLTGDGRWIEADAPGQAVLIFENKAPALTRTGYTIEAADVTARMDDRYPGLTQEANIPRHVELWWPSGPSEPLRPEGPLPQFVQYYAGSGCVTPPPYGNGTMHFYQLVWDRLIHGRSS